MYVSQNYIMLSTQSNITVPTPGTSIPTNFLYSPGFVAAAAFGLRSFLFPEPFCTRPMTPFLSVPKYHLENVYVMTFTQ